jgi:hypothetical protein
VLERLRREGMTLLGPLPADTMFSRPVLARGDCVLAMYHDQGLTALKYASFGQGINVTLGLPIIRTSVDHGTALDLAGTGEADPGSLFVAIEQAIEMASRSLRPTERMTHTSRASALASIFWSISNSLPNIVDLFAVQRDDRVVEIGPGLGALTAPLLRRLDHLQVVEIDRDIVSRLRQAYAPEKLTIHAGDALLFDFAQLAGAPDPGLRIVGNLPYNISTPLLFHLAGFARCVRDMHFMLQKEVVERMVAAPAIRTSGACRSCCSIASSWTACSMCRRMRSAHRPRSIRRWSA